MNSCLRALRIENGFTQKQLAEKLNTSDKNIWAYEKGAVTPPPAILIAYAKLFSVTLDYIFGLENDFNTRTVAPISDDYTAEEREIIGQYRELNPACKKLIKDNIKMLTTSTAVSKQKKIK